MKLLALVLLFSAFSSLSLTEVVENLNQWKSPDRCREFFIPNPENQNDVIVPTVFTEDHYKMICQRLANKYRFATLYDTKSRIPVYSAYTYYQDSAKLKKYYWKIEPQLDNITVSNDTDVKEMIDSIDVKDVKNIIHQAVDSDYEGKGNYSRGHVFPGSFAAVKDQRESTYTLTNIAPQIKNSNTEWAEEVEKKMKALIKSRCSLKETQKAYIVTGVVPGDQWLPITRHQNIPEGINIPSHYWTAFCCTSKKKLIGIGCIATMNNFSAQQHSIGNLNTQLSTLYGKNFSVFSGLAVENIEHLKTPFCNVTAD